MLPEFDKLIGGDAFHWRQIQQQPNFPAADNDFLQDLQRLVLASNYASAQLARYPELLPALHDCQPFNLDRTRLISALDNQHDPAVIKQLLRQFRHQKLVQIIFLDVCRAEPVEAVLKHLSELADVLIHAALGKAESILSSRHGQPQNANGEPMTLNIIGMGKLGGGELNFSSDIDLICCYADEGELTGLGKLSHAQYFSRVVKLFKELLHESTADGFVYRVDLRLRPWGDSGPVALSHSAFEHYYQLHGREWEQYAMVKARVITGSAADRAWLQSILRPFVYRRYHDYRVFDGLAQLKHQIDRQARARGKINNIKLGPGGIREIEFFVQAFQILKGGRNHSLQTPSLFKAMAVLAEQHIVDPKEITEMRAAYCFLRQLENRIQMFNDEQTHDLPSQECRQQRISRMLGYADWPALELSLRHWQEIVNRRFSRLFISDDARDAEAIDYQALSSEQLEEALQALGFTEPQPIRKKIEDFYQSAALHFMSDKAQQRFRSVFPHLLRAVAQQPDPPALLTRLLALMSAIAGRSVYFELLYQNRPLLQKLIQIFAASAWVAEQVTRYPMLLESVLYPGSLQARFDRARLQSELTVQLDNVAGDIELELDVLRQFKRAQTLVIASAELTAEIDATETSRQLSALAEILLQAVYRLSWRELVAQYGEPACRIDGAPHRPALGIIAYGKLGGHELHYQSDLDIIFLHDSSGESQTTLGQKALDNRVFFARLAQKIMSKINLRTAAGQLYEIDTRLRPDGASGMLVSTLGAYRQYQLDKAWVWEHQALTRARFVAGAPAIARPFARIRCEVLRLPRRIDALQQSVIEMRDRIYRAKNPPEGERINLKHSRGCLVDIEFLVQYWVLLNANKFASLCETTDNIGLLTELHELKLISAQQVQLRDIYQTFHQHLHARVLQNQSAEMSASGIQPLIDQVLVCWKNTFNDLTV